MDGQFTAVARVSEIQQLVDQHYGDLKGAILTLVSNQSLDHERAIEEAKRDLDVFKKAYMSSERANVEAASRHEQEKKALLYELNALKASETRERRVVALIDGDGAIFLPSLIALGREGGHIAASKLTESINRYLTPNQFQLHVYVFHNKRGLSNIFKRCGHQEAGSKFEDFIVGFNQSAERFAIIDAGELKEGSDHKIRAYLEDNIYSSQTSKVFFGGCHDNGYISVLNSFITSGYKDKLILLPGYSEMAVGIEKLGLPSLEIPDLFLLEKITGQITTSTGSPTLPALERSTTPPSTVSNHKSTASQSLREASFAFARRGSDPGTPLRTVDNVPSYKSVVQTVPVATKVENLPRAPSESSEESAGVYGRTSPSATRRINHKIPIWKHEPPPCTLFYLANCKYGSDCQYGHDYLLNEDDYELIRTNAKANPCTSVLRGDICSWGDKCVYGHICPQAPKCPRNVQGKCKFSAEVMHTTVG